MTSALLLSVYLLVLVGFLGLDVLGKVAPTTRSALLAGAGALSGTVLIAALLPATDGSSLLRPLAAAFAAAALTGGFVAAWRSLGGGRKRP